MSDERWREVTKADPCPACGKPDWCAWTPDGAMLKCERTTDAPRSMVLVKAQDGGGLFRREDNAASSCRVPVPRPQGPAQASASRIVATYDYRDSAGVLLYQSIRYEPKGFRFRRPDGNGGWTWRLGNVPRVLYRLPELLAADKGAWVFVCEGEKDCENVAALGLVATTNPGGAGKWGKMADDSALHSRRVAIIPDKDTAGLAHAQDVAAHLQGKASVVKMIDLPGMPPKGDGNPRKDASDWIEWLDGRTADELAAALVSMAQAAPEWRPPETGKGDSLILPAPVLTCLADVEPQEVRWLWCPRIPLGKLTLLVGDPALGKSLITLDMAARASRGNSFPGCPGAAHDPGGVVLLSAEDDAADTIVPRLLAAGADLSRIVKLDAVRLADREHWFNLDDDLPALEAAIRQVPACRLVIIDPISAYLGCRIDSHRIAEVRAVLAPLGELAARHGVALVAVAHLNKGQGPAMYRTSGSLGFVAAARAVYVFGKDKDDPTGERRFMLPVKANLTRETTGLAYRLDDTPSASRQPVVCWEADPVSITADEVLRDDTPGHVHDAPERDEAAAWLRDALAGGPLEAKDVYAKAREDGISKRTLGRAKGDLGVIAYREGFGAAGSWRWKLPQAPSGGQAKDCCPPDGQGPTPETVATFGEAGNLWGKPKENADSSAPQEAPDAIGCQALETGNVCPDSPGG